MDTLCPRNLAKAISAFACLAFTPFLIGLINAYFPGAGFLLFLIGLPTLLIALAITTIVWFVRGVRQAKSQDRKTMAGLYVLIGPVMCSLVLLVAWPSLFAGGFIGDLSRLAFNQDEYARIIAKARTARRAEWYAEDDAGVTYSVDIGPPVRVAFEPAGMLDNWSAIIYDPTGEMLLADGFDPETGKFRAPDSITELFGGDLVSCKRLWGDYLTCSFT